MRLLPTMLRETMLALAVLAVACLAFAPHAPASESYGWATTTVCGAASDGGPGSKVPCHACQPQGVVLPASPALASPIRRVLVVGCMRHTALPHRLASPWRASARGPPGQG